MATKVYDIGIDVATDLVKYVEKGKYVPVVQVLRAGSPAVLAPGEVNKWIEITSGKKDIFPDLKFTTDSGKPGLVHPLVPGTDGSHWGIKFEIVTPGSQKVWIAVETGIKKEITIENEDPDDVYQDDIDWPAVLDTKLVGSVLSINEHGGVGHVAPGSKHEHDIEHVEHSVSLVLETHTKISFWLTDHDADRPKLGTSPQEIWLAPGTARVQLPPPVTDDLNVLLWLQGRSDLPARPADVVSWEAQSHKVIVPFTKTKDYGFVRLESSGALVLVQDKEELEEAELIFGNGQAKPADLSALLKPRLKVNGNSA